MNPRKIKDQYHLCFQKLLKLPSSRLTFSCGEQTHFSAFAFTRRAEKRAGETKAEKCVCSPHARATSENTLDINYLFYSPPCDYLIQILVHCFPTVTALQFI